METTCSFINEQEIESILKKNVKPNSEKVNEVLAKARDERA